MSQSEEKAVFVALQEFAEAVEAKMNALTAGEPEDQLRAPFEVFMQEFGQTLHRQIVCTGETLLAGRLGKPDYAIHVGKLLAGYVELKSPGTGANSRHFKGHNKSQWKRFSVVPNILYTDGNEWALYRSGEQKRPLIRLSGDIASEGEKAVAVKDVKPIFGLLTDFLSWKPEIPTIRGKVDLKGFANLLAPLCRMLRDEVSDALKDANSPLVQLARDWRQLLFPEAEDQQFADAYAQTVTFALLLARSEGADPLDLDSAEEALAAEHSLLSRALEVLTDPNALAEISASVKLLIRVIGEVPQDALSGPEDPWLYFYEDFLASYDPELRRNIGAYYTPVEVVRAQVRLLDDLLTNRLGKPLGFADRDVVTLDPAVGTGTYLLGVIEHALNKVETQQGAGAVPGQATALAKNIYGFEILVGPFAVSELRISRALQDKGATLPDDGSHVYLTDTLESPNTPPPALPFYLKPIAEQHVKALQVKANVPVIVCLGNPPYDRHEAADEANKARTGGWIRWGDEGKGEGAVLNDFIAPAVATGHGRFLTGLYNLYVYFWRWALWKVFETNNATGPGIVSFISASSFLDGDAFCGMREHMRRFCDEIWILDLGGEGRGTRPSENIFAIQTPVAITVAVRFWESNKNSPATIHFADIVDGERNEKLYFLDTLRDFQSLTWQRCPNDWQSPFRPAGIGMYFSWPLIEDLFPWQQPGVKTHRPWVIGVNLDTLQKRWHALLQDEDRARAFSEDSDRRISDSCTSGLTPNASLIPISRLPRNAPIPPVQKYAFRSFDRQEIIADVRLMTRPRPVLWHTHGTPDSSRQVYLSTLINHPLGSGPGATVSAYIPDVHHFRGSYGGKDVLPLYRDTACNEVNISLGLLDILQREYRKPVTPEDFLAYVYGVLAQPAFTELFADELGTSELRIPLTKDGSLFAQIQRIGAKLIWLHTYGERFVPRNKQPGELPQGFARCTKPVPSDAENYPETYEYNIATKTLHVGDGQFAPVFPEVYVFEVSGLKVVQSWLGYRMKNPKGKKTSPLDKINPERWPNEFTTELLELLWVLEATISLYPDQGKLLEEVVTGPCFTAEELPEVPDFARKPPKRLKPGERVLYDQDEAE